MAPVLDDGARTRKVYLPRGRWVDVWRSATFTGGTLRPRRRAGLRVEDLAAAPVGAEASEEEDMARLMAARVAEAELRREPGERWTR